MRVSANIEDLNRVLGAIPSTVEKIKANNRAVAEFIIPNDCFALKFEDPKMKGIYNNK